LPAATAPTAPLLEDLLEQQRLKGGVEFLAWERRGEVQGEEGR
jgi:hypothetical protein